MFYNNFGLNFQFVSWYNSYKNQCKKPEYSVLLTDLRISMHFQKTQLPAYNVGHWYETIITS